MSAVEQHAEGRPSALQPINGYVTGWTVRVDSTTVARFYGAGSKRRAIAYAKERGLR